MIIWAEEVVFKAPDGQETSLVEFAAKIMDVLQLLQKESTEAENIHLHDDSGEVLTLDNAMWGCINAIEDLNDRLSALEARKANKLN